MYISITNKPKNITRKEIKFAVEFFANILMSPRIVQTLVIAISFVHITDAKAYTNQSSEDPRFFIIDIHDKISKRLIIRSIAHEMVHVKQYAQDEMKDLVRTPGKVRFKSKPKDGIYNSGDGDEYWYSPWEIDAYGTEVALYESYKEMIRSQKKELKNE